MKKYLPWIILAGVLALSAIGWYLYGLKEMHQSRGPVVTGSTAPAVIGKPGGM